MSLLLSLAYLPNTQYFSKLLTYGDITIEIHDTYQKQSYRNRATILGANGKLDLVIPVKRPQGNSTKTCDILIDYDMPWHRTHWKAIVSAYKNSPFFDIFEPELKPLFRKKEKYLIDWNLILIDALLEMTSTKITYTSSTDFITPPSPDYDDFRDTIHPKKRMQAPDPSYKPAPYFQVFNDKFGHIPNLSFIDLLFNEGPQAVYLCKRMHKKRAANTAALLD